MVGYEIPQAVEDISCPAVFPCDFLHRLKDMGMVPDDQVHTCLRISVTGL